MADKGKDWDVGMRHLPKSCIVKLLYRFLCTSLSLKSWKQLSTCCLNALSDETRNNVFLASMLRPHPNTKHMNAPKLEKATSQLEKWDHWGAREYSINTKILINKWNTGEQKKRGEKDRKCKVGSDVTYKIKLETIETKTMTFFPLSHFPCPQVLLLSLCRLMSSKMTSPPAPPPRPLSWFTNHQSFLRCLGSQVTNYWVTSQLWARLLNTVPVTLRWGNNTDNL